MKYDDAASNPMFDLPAEVIKSAAIEPVRDMDLVVRRSDRSVNVSDLVVHHAELSAGALAATQDYQSRLETSSEKHQLLASPVVNNFLPSPSRLLVVGGLGLIGALGLGAVASTFLTYRTTVNAQAVVEPIGEIQLVQANTSGTVETILVENYEVLEPNQAIASLEGTSLLTEISNIKAAIAQTQEQIVKVSNEITLLEQRRLPANSRQPAFSISSAKIFQYSKGLLQDHQGQLTTQLSRQREQLAAVESGLDRLSVRTPTAGTLYELALKYPGQTVSSNETVAKVIPAGMDVVIKAVVPEAQIKHVEVGQVARISLSACGVFGATPVKGEVTAVDPLDQTLSSTVMKTDAIAEHSGYMVTVETKPQNTQASPRNCQLLPGDKGEVTIMAKQETLLDLLFRKLRLKPNV